MELEEAIEQIINKSAQDAGRLNSLADYVKRRLAERGLPDVRGGSGGELRVRGLARTKAWDVAYNYAGKDRLLVSLKSIWRNASGTVPNRLDDLMGEAANVQQLSPEVVIGYVVLFDAKADSRRKQDGRLWSQYFEDAVKGIAIRHAPLWNQGLLEGVWFIQFDSAQVLGRRLTDPGKVVQEEQLFYNSLLDELKRREPAIPLP